MRLDRKFFERSPQIVAQELLGKILVRESRQDRITARIVETEAYGDAKDLASHARFGITNRNKIMYGPAGILYVYHIYGIFYLANIICENEGKPSAVLLRSAEILEGKELATKCIEQSKFAKLNDFLATGPGKLSLAFDFTKKENYTDIITSEKIWFEYPKSQNDIQIIADTRIGIDYASTSKNSLWRYYIKDNPFISKK